ncbi:MAG: VWA domain-containing protein [Acidobacteriota bacterium]|nr:MAG: VWA domain-containing protein [Acidobacteriota bacterium]
MRRLRARTGATMAASMIAVFAWSLAEEPEPTAVSEQAEVRLVQVDVSVIDPKGSSYRSVEGLSLEQFEIRLDGRELSDEQREALRFDPICAAADGEILPAAAPRPIIALVDFNYLDGQGRADVARAIETLADRGAEEGPDEQLIYKIYGFTRQLTPLTDGFTSDPALLARAARLVRETAWRSKPADPPRRGPSAFADPPDAGAESDVPSSDDEPLVDAQELAGFDILESVQSLLETARLSDFWGDARSEYRASASLAAIEMMLRAHGALSGRKILVLFSSEAFAFSQRDRLEQETAAITELARQGFAIWTVDAAGLMRERTGRSSLISLLAQDTGGGSVRNTSALDRAFDGAAEQLSCYYLFSLPVAARPEKDESWQLSVRLDTDRYPELWGYRIVAPSRISVPERKKVLDGRRLAGLLSPEDFRDPPVAVTVDFPTRRGERRVLPVRLRVPLRELRWRRAEQGVAARLLADAVIERLDERGVDLVCQLGAEKTGELELRLARAPRADERAALAIELPCVIKRDGLFSARGVVTDLADERVGAGHSTVFVGRPRGESWQVFTPRVEAASGRDLFWGPGLETPVRDRQRRVWRAVDERSPAEPDDRVALSYVLCGPDASGAGEELKHLLARLGADGSVVELRSFQPDAFSLSAGQADEGPFCAAARVGVAELTLGAGRYAFAVANAAMPADALRPLLQRHIETRSRGERLPEGILALSPFTIAAP